jgi:hypothetical protein
MRGFVLTGLLSFMTCTAVAQDVSSSCVGAAYSSFAKANTAILRAGTPLMSVDAVVEQRRLEENYCMNVARCTVANAVDSIPYRGAFSACLRDMAMEKYDAAPRNGN